MKKFSFLLFIFFHTASRPPLAGGVREPFEAAILSEKEVCAMTNPHCSPCNLCPRRCGALRRSAPGFCGGGELPRIARAALHYWEEPCISGEEGSGTVFFSGCPLRCCYCQNHRISQENFGREVSIPRLGEIFLELQDQGANNLNLVTAGHYLPQVIQALELVRGRLHIPVVYNSSGYERVEALRMLEGYVDIYLPDLKYRDPRRGQRYSQAPDYFAVASAAVLEMFRQVGPVAFDRRGMLQKGLVVRHLVLPQGLEDTAQVLGWVARSLPLEDILVSLMSQYTPFYRSGAFPEIDRRLTPQEYAQALELLDRLGIENGFVQELSSAQEEYTPDFSLQGVEAPGPKEPPL